MTMTSAGSSGSSMTSALPAARRPHSRTEGTAATPAATKTTARSPERHLVQRGVMRGSSFGFDVREAPRATLYSRQTAYSGTQDAGGTAQFRQAPPSRGSLQDLAVESLQRLSRRAPCVSID